MKAPCLVKPKPVSNDMAMYLVRGCGVYQKRNDGGALDVATLARLGDVDHHKTKNKPKTVRSEYGGRRDESRRGAIRS